MDPRLRWYLLVGRAAHYTLHWSELELNNLSVGIARLCWLEAICILADCLDFLSSENNQTVAVSTA